MISIHMLEETRFKYPTFKVLVGGEQLLIGRVISITEQWHVRPEVGIAKPGRKILTTSYRSKEAAACALAMYYYEGEKEVRSGDDDDSSPVS